MKHTGAKYLTLVSRTPGRTLSFQSLGACAMPTSSAKPMLWIRTAAGPTIGFGHLRRSITLARMLSSVLHPVFLHDPDDHWTQDEVAQQGWMLEPLEPGGLWELRSAPSGLLIDTREETGLKSLISEARNRSIPVLSIHDLGLNPLPSDVVIDGSIFPSTRDFPRRDTAFYTGTAYLVLDPAFGMLHQQRKRIRERIQSVVINLGGGDSGGRFETVLEGLKSWGRELEVVGFPGFAYWGQRRLADRDWGPLEFRWAKKDEAVERLLFRADIAITAGGLASFEALCVGTPLLALSLDGFQHFTVSMIAKADACIDLGESLKPAAIPGLLDSIEAAPGRRERMSFRGKQIVDGRGAERVCRLIRRLVGETPLQASTMVN